MFESAAAASVSLLEKIAPEAYGRLARLFYSSNYPNFNLCNGDIYDRYDYVDDEELEFELSMSNEKCNTHPYRGRVDEFAGGDELQEAVAALPTLRASQAELARQKLFEHAHLQVSVILQFH